MVTRLHHLEANPLLEVSSSVGPRSRAFRAVSLANWFADMAAKKSAPTARDYVQNGLCCMLDGIDNAGFGVHDDNLQYWYDLAREAGGGNNWDVTASASSGTRWEQNGLFVPAGVNIGIGDGSKYFSTPFGGVAPITDYTCEMGMYFPNFSKGFSSLSVTRIGYSFFECSRPWAEKQMRLAKSGDSRASHDADGSSKLVNMESYIGADRTLCVSSTNDLASKVGKLCINGEVKTNGAYKDLGASDIFRYGPIIFASSDDRKILFIRVYTRALTNDEIAANYAVDKARFGLA